MTIERFQGGTWLIKQEVAERNLTGLGTSEMTLIPIFCGNER